MAAILQNNLDVKTRMVCADHFSNRYKLKPALCKGDYIWILKKNITQGTLMIYSISS